MLPGRAQQLEAFKARRTQGAQQAQPAQLVQAAVQSVPPGQDALLVAKAPAQKKGLSLAPLSQDGANVPPKLRERVPLAARPAAPPAGKDKEAKKSAAPAQGVKRAASSLKVLPDKPAKAAKPVGHAQTATAAPAQKAKPQPSHVQAPTAPMMSSPPLAADQRVAAVSVQALREQVAPSGTAPTPERASANATPNAAAAPADTRRASAGQLTPAGGGRPPHRPSPLAALRVGTRASELGSVPERVMRVVPQAQQHTAPKLDLHCDEDLGEWFAVGDAHVAAIRTLLATVGARASRGRRASACAALVCLSDPQGQREKALLELARLRSDCAMWQAKQQGQSIHRVPGPRS
jgi:hypothetical protein